MFQLGEDEADRDWYRGLNRRPSHALHLLFLVPEEPPRGACRGIYEETLPWHPGILQVEQTRLVHKLIN